MANWREVVALCSEERIFWDDHYYRFRKIGDDTYELSRLVAGPCGENTYHPKLTVKVENEMFIPMTYFDNTDTPVKEFTREDDESFIDQEFVTLLEMFMEAKEHQE
ncbi:hypothetical protein IV487_01960 [Enterococcus saccharolyticus]|uniref:Uncharacterized protein n=1 Tax=Candidatus Enterococcus willemsii TaxID=1857215 RepID=A0ABQ6Z269_9ENTE|nr:MULTISPECIES: hypothetical protein [Enterococcus]KAF1305681.1 hypothetical protein BAU17_00065 [Enterococcus sp. CU12B]MCD5001229.1 hypothetical protein [Enterococcus saccharolyticus]